MYATALSKPLCLNLENVPGLPDHPHFSLLTRVLNEAGWVLAVANIDQIYPLLPVMRARWMATCISKLLQCDPKHVLIAKDIHLPDLVPGVGHDNHLMKFGCMMKNLKSWELQQCLPNDQAMEMTSNPDLLPLKHRTKNFKNLKPEEVIQLRITTGLRPLPNVMALQGSQHLLPSDLLVEKGLHAYLLNDGTNLRFITPIEISTAMGFPHSITLPAVFPDAWKMVGNSLAVPHAALQCLRAHYILGPHSVFENGIKGPMELCDFVMTTRFSLSAFDVVHDDEWMSLRMIQTKTMVPQSIPETLPVSDEEDDDGQKTFAVSQDPYLDSVCPPLAKRVCISPTWQAIDEDTSIVPELSKADFPNCASWTVGTKQPCIGGLDLSVILIHEPKQDSNFMCVKILHSQGIWAVGCLLEGQPSVSEAFRHFLPHATQDHFQTITLNQFPAVFGTRPKACTHMNIVFKPYCFLRIVQAPWLVNDLPVEIDVTWTFADLISFVACEAAVLSSCVRLLVDNERMQSQDYVMQSPHVAFQAVIVTSENHRQPLVANDSNIKQDILLDRYMANGSCDAATPVHKGLIRFTTRHPKWGSVRSVTVPLTATASEAISILLPGFEKSNPKFCVDNQVVVFKIASLKHSLKEIWTSFLIPQNHGLLSKWFVPPPSKNRDFQLISVSKMLRVPLTTDPKAVRFHWIGPYCISWLPFWSYMPVH